MIVQQIVPVQSKEEIAEGIFALSFKSQVISRSAQPGQFVNIKSADGCLPLLRRPFSISRIDGDTIELLFNVIGQGTRMMAAKRAGDGIDVLGPLGVPFNYKSDYQTAINVGGGLGIAPFPFLTERLRSEKKSFLTVIGARTGNQLVTRHLENTYIATDDGSIGFHGNVVQFLEEYLSKHTAPKPKIFGCGPTKMLQSLSAFAKKSSIECEISLEGDMACGIGLCQGCPVERSNGQKKYALVCVEGPTFNCNDVVLSS
ncbi:MAG: dihydroorotate dehydrogenase electron transfer subunit [Ignavibacteriales bacterium]|nr:dihydroorotate dehydrogenase electron transfer subunit [Ignavibacteriales bacterium]